MSKISQYINDNLDIGEEYQRITGHTMPEGKFMCFNPEHIHHNNTPSMKRYGNGAKCFGQCQRYFSCYDMLRMLDPARIREIESSVILPSAVTYNRASIVPISIDRTLPIEQIIPLFL